MSKENLLESIAQKLEKCPLCEASSGFKIVGLIGKKLECNSCKAKWSGDIGKDGTKWLKLEKPSKTGKGKYLVNLAFQVEFWLDADKPFLKWDHYTHAIYEAFKDLENTPDDGVLGKARFSGKYISLLAPSINWVAEIYPYMEGKEVRVAVLDLTLELKEKTREENDWFYYMTSKRLNNLSKEVPLTPFIKVGKEIRKVKENTFYPFNERNIQMSAETVNRLIRYGVLTPIEET